MNKTNLIHILNISFIFMLSAMCIFSCYNFNKLNTKYQKLETTNNEHKEEIVILKKDLNDSLNAFNEYITLKSVPIMEYVEDIEYLENIIRELRDDE